MKEIILKTIPKFNNEQLKYVADILNNLGVVFSVGLALMVLESKLNYMFIVAGTFSALACWFLGIKILERKEQ